ncbi:hypothetical protein BKH46_08375 [Helicobacter sp. 12S02634-8]|uniref:hypothetical protein n=1 Tax=Helicobacter sp. 12S02634-8 TaxID=1476199 RepID=UPI000BA72FA1|nr:hypothetical protein [Helicobacter sp. 12S02634-8]PAF46246.1 hypothetical protein BKH46_08375 [Helicobacter sp. 12S02634-8]
MEADINFKPEKLAVLAKAIDDNADKALHAISAKIKGTEDKSKISSYMAEGDELVKCVKRAYDSLNIVNENLKYIINFYK